MEKMGPPTDSELENFQNEVSEMDRKSQSIYAKSLIQDQIIHLFQNFEKNSKNDYEAEARIEQEKSDAVHIAKKRLLITNFEFSVKTQKSLLPNAGNGVFVSINVRGEYEDRDNDVNTDPNCQNISNNNNKIDAIIVPGTVVAFFPGLVYTKADLRRSGAVDNLFPDNNLMLMSRYDGTIIDSRKANQTPSNPFSLAHRVNHCGDENVPNVLPVRLAC